MVMANSRKLGDSVFQIQTDITSNTITFSTAETQRLTIDANGNVGIATNSPTKKLDVVGDMSVSGTITQGGIDTRAFAIAMATALSM